MTAPTNLNDLREVAVTDDPKRFVSLAASLGEAFAPRAADHDRANSFVAENYDELRRSGYLRLAVPEDLGGLGASMLQVAYAQAELAKHCGSTALAVAMHLYQTLAHVYRWRHGAPGADVILKKIATDDVILMTSGGSDGLWPSTTAVREDGGYRVFGRKAFCSQSPVATIMATMAVYDDPAEGRVVLASGIPTSSPGFQIVETWDTLGMRGTSSHDVVLDGVFVGDAQVVARRPWGKMDPVLRNAAIHFAPVVAAVYYGIADGARQEAVQRFSSASSANGEARDVDPSVVRQIGLMDAKLRTAWWAITGAVADIGDHYALDDATLGTVMLAKRVAVLEAIEVVNIAMDTVGGSSYFKTSRLERALRDVRAGTFHPINPEKMLTHAGRMALDQSVENIW